MLFRYKKLPYFRMSACNSGSEPFDRLSKDERIAVQKEAIALIGKFATRGAVITLDQAAFNRTITSKGFVRTPYEFCVWMILTAVQVWIDGQQLSEKVGAGYFFESGHAHQKMANGLMNKIFTDETMKRKYRYKAHRFVDKASVRPTQAADILAWQWYKDLTRRKNGLKKSRADCVALLHGTPHHVLHANEEMFQQAIDWMNFKAGGNWGNELAALALRDPTNPIFPRKPGEHGDSEAFAKFIKQHRGDNGQLRSPLIVRVN